VRPLSYNPHLPLLTVIDFGKHHPCMIFGQYTPWNQLVLLGGVMGQDMFLEDFAPTALRYRAQWFPDVLYHMEACDPAGAHDNSQGVRQNGIEVLKTFGLMPRYKENSNAPDVRLAMVERLAGLMRKRTTQGEAFGVEADPAKWLLVTQDQARSWPFVADAFEAGYVWDEHYVSVGSKQLRKPKKDGWYEHGMNCCEYLELNFGGAQPSVKAVERSVEAQSRAALKRAQRDSDPADFGYGRLRTGRGGYV
jgi:hypothetical protein